MPIASVRLAVGYAVANSQVFQGRLDPARIVKPNCQRNDCKNRYRVLGKNDGLNCAIPCMMRRSVTRIMPARKTNDR